jgi:hypothetical protein
MSNSKFLANRMPRRQQQGLGPWYGVLAHCVATTLLAGVGLLGPMGAVASDGDSQPSPPQEAAMGDNTPKVDPTTSAAIREQLSYDVWAHAGFQFLASAGLGFGTYVSPNDQLEAGYSRGRFLALLVDIESSNIELRYKRFLGNSFFVNGVLGATELRVKSPLIDVISELSETEGSFSARAKHVYVGLDIGNKWQWKNWFISCDWIGLTHAFHRWDESVNRPTPKDEKGEDELKKSEDFWGDFRSFTVPRLLNLSVGVSF